MESDIVARLRQSHRVGCDCFGCEAADEIERLRSVVEAWRVYSSRAERDILELREQRDGARAEVCLLRTATSATAETVNQSMADYAESRGWHDLFRENTDGK